MDGKQLRQTGTSVAKQDKPKTREDLQALMKPVSERFDPQQEAQNAAVVSFELEAVSTKVDRFGWSGLSQEMKQRLSDDWTSKLRKYQIAEVRRGIDDYMSERAKAGLPAKCPTEYEVEAKIMKRRGQAMQRAAPTPISQQEERGERVSPEKAAEILREAGMTRDRLDRVERGEKE